MKLEFRHFELVDAIQKGGNLSAAAKLLGLSQPAVSTAFKSLEKNIGGKLFETGSNGLMPTRLADIFLSRNMALRGPLDQIRADIESIKQGRFGQLNIGTGFNPPLLSLYPALAQLQNEMPNLSINLVERDWRDIMVAIASETIDFGIIDVSIAEKSDQFHHKRLRRHLCCVVVRRGHPLEGRTSLSIDDIMPYSYCGPNPSRWAIDHAGVGAKIFGEVGTDYGQITGSFNAHTFYTALNMLLNTNSFSVLLKHIFKAHHSQQLNLDFTPHLVVLEVEGLDWLRTNYGLVWRLNRRLTEFDYRFMDIIEEVERGILGDDSNLDDV